MTTLLNVERLVLIACLLYMAAGRTHACDDGSSVDTPAPMDEPPVDALFNTPSVEVFPEHEVDIREMVSNIENVYSDFIEDGHVYNNVDSYYRFYNAYVTAKEENSSTIFSQFLLNYKVKKEDIANEPVGYLLRLMERIKSETENPLIKIDNSAYLITASPFDKDNIKLSDYQGDKKPSYWKYEHVAGIIKFKLDKMNSFRVGYILLDPKYLIQPVVIMEDGKKVPFSHGSSELIEDKCETLSSSLGSISWFKRFLEKNNLTSHDVPKGNFIAGTYNVLQRRNNIQPYPGGRYLHHLNTYDRCDDDDPLISETVNIVYFFKKPYLTFVKNTIKPSLLLPERTMKSFNGKNQMTATAQINVSGLESHHVENIKTFSYCYYDESHSKESYLTYLNGWIYGNFYNRDPIYDIAQGKTLDDVEDQIKRLSSRLGVNSKDCITYWTTLIQKFKNLNEEFLNEAKSAVENYIQENKRSTEWDLGYEVMP